MPLIECQDCGKYVSNHLTVCPSCGGPVDNPGNTMSVPCPDCGRQVSNQSQSCPYCGDPVESTALTYQPQLNNVSLNDSTIALKKKSKLKLILIPVISVAVTLGVVLIFLNMRSSTYYDFANEGLAYDNITHSDGVAEEEYFEPTGHLVEDTITLPGGEILEGRFENGQLVEGRAIFPNGQISEGRFERRQLVEGTITFPDGEILEGRFENGQFVEGIRTLPSGAISEGRFENRQLVEGTLTLPSGEIAEGRFEGRQLVEGTLTLPGGVLEGRFEDWRLVEGTMTLPGGQIQEVSPSNSMPTVPTRTVPPTPARNASDRAAFDLPKYFMVNAGVLNVRAAADINSRVIGRLRRGDIVEVTQITAPTDEIHGGWAWVGHGWSNMDYLLPWYGD